MGWRAATLWGVFLWGWSAAGAEFESPRSVPLTEIGRSLLEYSHTHGRPPRLALVLSGGGAKCAYQVGAVSALEEELARLRAEHPQTAGLDIAVVVGTSGGAINAVPVAMGVSRTAAGQRDMGQMWRGMDQRHLLQPPRLVRAVLGIWLMAVQAVVVVALSGRGGPAGSRRRRVIRSLAFVVLGGVQLAVAHNPWLSWQSLGEDHMFHHLCLLGTIGVRWTAWCLLAFGLAGLLAGLIWDDTGERFTAVGRWMRRGLWSATLGLPLVLAWVVLLHEETLSGDGGIERAVAGSFETLVNGELARRGLTPESNLLGPANGQRLATLSRTIGRHRMLQRDLVLTGAALAAPGHELPGDLYLHVTGAGGERGVGNPEFARRGLPLDERPELLLDVVIGSGAVYPVFPPRTLPNLPQPGQAIELVDGSFSHRSPIEAAVLWGATHVVLIQAWPNETIPRGSLLANTAAALCHLYDQAQLIDERSKQDAVIFTLAPQPPFMCMFDFADNLIDDAIAQGYRDARAGRIIAAEPSLVRAAGPVHPASPDVSDVARP
jgi:predicted acylesterase/phospholipase RssA